MGIYLGMINVSRPSGTNVGVNNPGKTVYITGNESTDGSLRLNVADFVMTRTIGFESVTEIQKRIDGIWQPTSFKTAGGSVLVGTLVALSAAGNNLITVDADENINFNAKSLVESGVTSKLANIIHASAFFVEVVFFGDTDGEFTGTVIERLDENVELHLISNKFYLKTGNTAATEPLRFQTWDGVDDSGILIFDQTYPASLFAANIDTSIGLEGFLEFTPGGDSFSRISSAADFSLLTNADESEWYVAGDFSIIQNDDLLQTSEYIDGDNFDEGDWTVKNRKIFECNITGIQTGEFEDNLDKWDVLAPPTMHDRQDIIVEGPITTTSTTFVNIPGARLLTGDLGSSGNYQMWLSMSIQQSNNNTSITIRAVLDGVPGEGRNVFFGPGSSNEPQHATLIGQADSIGAGSLIEFQWLVSGGEGQINNLRIMIDGVREDQLHRDLIAICLKMA